ncbi:uncharacterized protein LOC143227460 [Tachypleus tridentatus]|uniref:uncharacterized protein LOC143227460 n=1 Tax=Tachypleus tridentatus TaxID=6853 RepID=UPI003FD4BA7F
MWKRTFLAIVAGIWVVLILGIFLDESVIKWKTSELKKGSEVKSWIIDNGISKMNQREFFPRDEGFMDTGHVSRIKKDLSNGKKKRKLSGDKNLWAWELKANISLKSDAEKHRIAGDLNDFRTKNVIKHKNISKNGNKVARPPLYNTDEFDLILKSKGVNKSKVELFQTWDLMKNFMNALFQNLESDPDHFSVNLQYKLKKKEPRVCSKDRDNKTEILKHQTLNSTVSTTENVTAELADLKLAESSDVLDRESRVGFIVDANSQEQKPSYLITDSSIVPGIASTTKDVQTTTTSEALRKYTILSKELSKSSKVKEDFQKETTRPERIPVTDYFGTEVTSTTKTIVSDTDSSLRIAATASTTTSIAVDATGLTSAKTSSDSNGTTNITSLSTSDETVSAKKVDALVKSAGGASTTKDVATDTISFLMSAETASIVTGLSTSVILASSTKGVTDTSLSTSDETVSTMKVVTADTMGFSTSAETASPTTTLPTSAETVSTMKVVTADTKGISTSAETASPTTTLPTSAETVSTMKVVTADTKGISTSSETASPTTTLPTSAETVSTMKVVTADTKGISTSAETASPTTTLPTSAETVSTMKVVTADTKSLIAETFSAATPMAADLKGLPTSAETASTTTGLPTSAETASTTTGLPTSAETASTTTGLPTSAETASTATGLPTSAETASTATGLPTSAETASTATGLPTSAETASTATGLPTSAETASTATGLPTSAETASTATGLPTSAETASTATGLPTSAETASTATGLPTSAETASTATGLPTSAETASTATGLPTSAETASTATGLPTSAETASTATGLPTSAETASTATGLPTSAETASTATGLPTSAETASTATGLPTSAETASTATGLPTSAETASTATGLPTSAETASTATGLPTSAETASTATGLPTSAETASTATGLPTSAETASTATGLPTSAETASTATGLPTSAETASTKVVTGDTKNLSKRADTFETTYLPWITRTVSTTLNDQGFDVSETFHTFSGKTDIPYATEVVGRRILRVTETSSPVIELFTEDTRFSDMTETYKTAIPSKPTKLLTARPIIELTDFSGGAKSSTDLEKVETEEASYSATWDIPKSITISTKEYIGDKTAEKVALFPSTHLATDVEVKPSSSFSSPISSGELLADLTTVSSFDRSVIAGLEESPVISPARNFSMIIGEEISLFTSSSVSDEILEKIKNASLLARVIFTPDLEPTKVASTQQTLETFDPGSTETSTVLSLSSALVDIIPANVKSVAADGKVLSSAPNISCSTLSACASELQNLLMHNVGDIKNNYIILIVLNNSVVYGNILPGVVSEIIQQIPSNLNMKEVLNNVKNITTIGAQTENINKLVSLTKTQRISSLHEKRVDSGVETARIRNCSNNETVSVKKGTSLVEEGVSFTTASSIDHVELVPEAMKSVSGIEESIKLLPTEHNQSYPNLLLSTSYIDHNKTELGVNLEPAENITKESTESENNFLNVWNKISDTFKDSFIIEIKPQTKPFITESLNISPTSRQNISTIPPRRLDVDSSTLSSGSFIPWISESFTKDLSLEIGSKSSDFWSERDLSEFSAGSSSEPGISLLMESETMQNDSLWIGSGDESSGDLWIGSGTEWSDKFWTGNELSELSVEIGKEPTDIFGTGSEITKVPYSPSTTHKLWNEEIFGIENKLNTTQLEDLNGIKSFEATNVLKMKTIGEYKSEATIMKMNSTTRAVSETEQPHTLSSDRSFVANLTPNGKPKVVTLLGFDIPVFQTHEDGIDVTGKSLLNADFTAKVSRERMDNLTSSSISSEIKLFTPTSKLTTGNDERVISKPVIKTKIKQNITRHPASLKMTNETTHGREDWMPHFKFDKMVKETTKSVSERTLSTAYQRKHLTPSFKRKTSLKDYTSVRKPDEAHIPITLAENHTLSVSRSAEAPELSLQRFCTSIQHCNASLKERCVSKDTHSICECGSAFARNPQTSVCQEKIPIMASLKFPNEEFTTDLDNPTSVIHQRKKRDAEQTMWSVVQLSDSLQKLVAHVIVDSFSAGSVVLNIQMILAGLHQDMSPEELETFVGREIEDVLNNKIHLMQGGASEP